MIRLPIVLILSEGKVSPKEIVNNIRKVPEKEEKEIILSEAGGIITGYIFHLTTKYYKTDLYLVPHEDDISLIPGQIQDNIECVLIYFDSGKRSFSNRIPVYAEFLRENGIELGILLCGRLYDDSNEGITYKEAKQESKLLDVIELERKRDEDEEEDPHDPLGYDELLQAMRSFIWSNVNVGASSKDTNLQKTMQKNPEKSTEEAEKEEEKCENTNPENSVEAELAVFEKLMAEVMMFKNTTSSWSRNERLAYAEKFADKFEQLIGDGKLSSDDEG